MAVLTYQQQIQQLENLLKTKQAQVPKVNVPVGVSSGGNTVGGRESLGVFKNKIGSVVDPQITAIQNEIAALKAAYNTGADLAPGMTNPHRIPTPPKPTTGPASILDDVVKGAAKGAGSVGAGIAQGAVKWGARGLGNIGGVIVEEALWPSPTQEVEESEYFKELNKLAKESGKLPKQMTPGERERIALEAQRKTRKNPTDNPLYNPEEGIKAIDDIINNKPKVAPPKAPKKDDVYPPFNPKFVEFPPRNYEPKPIPIDRLLKPLPKNPLAPDVPVTPSPNNPLAPATPRTPSPNRPIAPPVPWDPKPTPNNPLSPTPENPFKPIEPESDKPKAPLTPTTPAEPKNPPVDKPGYGGVNLNFPISENLLSMRLDLNQIGEKQVQPRLDKQTTEITDKFKTELGKELDKATEKIITNQTDQTAKIITALSAIPALVGTALAPKFGDLINKMGDFYSKININVNEQTGNVITTLTPQLEGITNNINGLPGKIINPVNNNTNMVGANLLNNTTNQSQVIQKQIHETQANNLTALTTLTGQCNPACGSGGGNVGTKKNPNNKDAVKKVKFPDPTKEYKRPNPRNKWAIGTKPPMKELELKTDDDKMNYLVDAINRLDTIFPIGEITGGKFDKDLMAPTGITGDRNIPLYNYFQLLEYMFRTWDKRTGAPAPIKIKDSDPLTPGSQPLTIKPANLFEATNLIYKTSFDASRDIDLTNALATRTMLMTANCYKVVAQLLGYLETIVADLGMETSEEMKELNLPCDPYAGGGKFNADGKGFNFEISDKFKSNKEQDIEDLAASMLKPGKIPVKYIKKVDVATLRNTLEGIARFAAAAVAPNALPINDIDKIIKHRVKQEELETALQVRRAQMANGFGPIEKKKKPK